MSCFPRKPRWHRPCGSRPRPVPWESAGVARPRATAGRYVVRVASCRPFPRAESAGRCLYRDLAFERMPRERYGWL